jgi:hypothetical protein
MEDMQYSETKITSLLSSMTASYAAHALKKVSCTSFVNALLARVSGGRLELNGTMAYKFTK